MARLSLSFKGHQLKVYALGGAETLIGSDPACGVHIDSLAVAARHARVVHDESGFILELLDPGAEIRVNDEPVARHELADGDVIQVGKHTLTFARFPEEPAAAPPARHTGAWVQVLSGPQVGRAIRLDKASTRLGPADGPTAAISTEGDDFRLTHIEGEPATTLDGEPLDTAGSLLRDGQRIAVGALQLMFYREGDAGEAAQAQRRFTRVGFDAEAVLSIGAQRWQTRVIDLSMKGALVRRPAGWDIPVGTAADLRVRLAEDTEIDMTTRVARVEQDHVGLACDAIDVDSITHLRRLIELNLAEPALLERELGALG